MFAQAAVSVTTVVVSIGIVRVLLYCLGEVLDSLLVFAAFAVSVTTVVVSSGLIPVPYTSLNLSMTLLFFISLVASL